MLDIFSRKAMRWEVHVTENADLAQAFIENAIIGNGGVAPRAVHADRGTSMTSKPVAALLADLHIAQSHSRPHVSNDNPYSEAQFRPSNTVPPSPDSSGPSTTPAPSATSSSPTTTMTTAIPASGYTHPPRSTTAPP